MESPLHILTVNDAQMTTVQKTGWGLVEKGVKLYFFLTLFRCYTPTEFALFGIGAIVMGVMLGVVGISWFKHQVCILFKQSLA